MNIEKANRKQLKKYLDQNGYETYSSDSIELLRKIARTVKPQAQKAKMQEQKFKAWCLSR